MATAGRILIVPRGDFSASTTYEMLDLVNYNSATWLAKKTSVGIAPSEASSEYWFRMQGSVIQNPTQIANNLTTTASGYALDARQGKALMDSITSTNTKVSGIETTLGSAVTRLSTAETTLASTATKLSTAETNLAGVTTRMGTAETNISKLQTNATITKGTLAIGSTSIALSNSNIKTTSVLSIYTSVWGVNPKTVAVESGKVTLTFDAQTVAVEVGVRVDG